MKCIIFFKEVLRFIIRKIYIPKIFLFMLVIYTPQGLLGQDDSRTEFPPFNITRSGDSDVDEGPPTYIPHTSTCHFWSGTYSYKSNEMIGQCWVYNPSTGWIFKDCYSDPVCNNSTQVDPNLSSGDRVGFHSILDEEDESERKPGRAGYGNEQWEQHYRRLEDFFSNDRSPSTCS